MCSITRAATSRPGSSPPAPLKASLSSGPSTWVSSCGPYSAALLPVRARDGDLGLWQLLESQAVTCHHTLPPHTCSQTPLNLINQGQELPQGLNVPTSILSLSLSLGFHLERPPGLVWLMRTRHHTRPQPGSRSLAWLQTLSAAANSKWEKILSGARTFLG